jgi:hypothetical protein
VRGRRKSRSKSAADLHGLARIGIGENKGNRGFRGVRGSENLKSRKTSTVLPAVAPVGMTTWKGLVVRGEMQVPPLRHRSGRSGRDDKSRAGSGRSAQDDNLERVGGSRRNAGPSAPVAPLPALGMTNLEWERRLRSGWQLKQQSFRMTQLESRRFEAAGAQLPFALRSPAGFRRSGRRQRGYLPHCGTRKRPCGDSRRARRRG